jgi:hypothetical protein
MEVLIQLKLKTLLIEMTRDRITSMTLRSKSILNKIMFIEDRNNNSEIMIE